MARKVDINCDLGEGMENDAAIMPYISSCSIACGGHFGNEQSITESIRLAKKHQVKVGAHPSFPDKANFGRLEMKIDNEMLKASIFDQIMLFNEVCKLENATFNHIKLHGALYNLASKSEEVADLVIETIIDTGVKCKLYAPYASVLAKKSKAYFEICYEAFIDRAYKTDLSLVNRSEPMAILTESEEAWNQLYEMIKHQEVTTVDNHKAVILADTFCVHGDNQNVVELLGYINNQLQEVKIQFKDA